MARSLRIFGWKPNRRPVSNTICRLGRAVVGAPNVYNDRSGPYTWRENAERYLKISQTPLLGLVRNKVPGAWARKPSGVAQAAIKVRVG